MRHSTVEPTHKLNKTANDFTPVWTTNRKSYKNDVMRETSHNPTRNLFGTSLKWVNNEVTKWVFTNIQSSDINWLRKNDLTDFLNGLTITIWESLIKPNQNLYLLPKH